MSKMPPPPPPPPPKKIALTGVLPYKDWLVVYIGAAKLPGAIMSAGVRDHLLVIACLEVSTRGDRVGCYRVGVKKSSAEIKFILCKKYSYFM